VNLILFEENETCKPLPKRDGRTVHLIKVLHKKNGDTFDAGVLAASCRGGGRGTGKIEKINTDGSLEFSLNLDEPPPPRLPIRVAVGFPRPIQIRRLLRDLSGLGVGFIDLFGTELGEKSYRDTKLFDDGGARVALIEGAIQSRDTTLPELRVFPNLDKWLQGHPWENRDLGSGNLLNTRRSLAETRGRGEHGENINILEKLEGKQDILEDRLCDLCASAPLRDKIPDQVLPLLIAADNIRPQGLMTGLASERRPVVLAIGSERGWSDRERDLLEEAGFLRLSLGSRAMRTETACIAATVLATYLLQLNETL